MDPKQIPTVSDVANMLDSVAMSDRGCPETLHVALWLIDQSPEAREIYQRLLARREGEPSLMDLAKLFCAVEQHDVYPESAYTAQWLFTQSADGREVYARLEQLAEDAAINRFNPCWAVNAAESAAELDDLLASLDDWNEAEEVIEDGHHRESTYEYLINHCRARARRARDGERQRLDRLRVRLQRSALRCGITIDREERLTKVLAPLVSLRDPESTLETVEELLLRLRGAPELRGQRGAADQSYPEENP